MKNYGIKKYAGAFLGTLLALGGLSSTGHAQLVLSYEDTVSGHAIGEAFTGQFRINLQNFDMGSLYPNLGAPGTAAGYGAGGSATSVADGITTLNGIQTAGSTGAIGEEDTWGIARILTITDLAGSVVWSEAGKNQQLTVVFYGEQDFYVNQLADGFQEINGVGLHVDIYLQDMSDPAFTQYDPLQGSAGRSALDQYATVTDGWNILRTVSKAGFLHDDGVLGGLDTEFSSIFNASSGGTGQVYLDVIGGTDAALFDTDAFTSPFIPGQTADLFAQFTTTVFAPGAGVSDWLVRSNDPVTGIYASPIPEPSTYGLIGATVLAGAMLYRRRQRNKSAGE
jgi:PEP-CTERM putative exosortase interaction domain